MQIGDLVDDGLDNIGVIVDLGWTYPTGGQRQPAYLVHFPTFPKGNGWYDDNDLKLISRTMEETCK
tara:strand:- start:15 stop:212 length:198 start_codon:yes stop_codon:yes gene_type:complete